MHILRNQIYSDKLMAVLREYSTNAMDANIEAGKAGHPIVVFGPTLEEPTLRIRDYGLGMTQEQVLYHYTQYGASSKRQSNATTGMLGIGSKSGFCYGDMFMITSWHGGMRTTYVASLDAGQRGCLNMMTSDPCDPAETGIEIAIPIKQKDFGELGDKARYLYRFFNPRPTLHNITLEKDPAMLTSTAGHWYLEEIPGNSPLKGWVAVMGNIPYRVDLSQFVDDEGTNLVPDAMGVFSGAVYMPLGSIEFNAGREGLEYSEKTKAAILAQFDKLINERLSTTRAMVADPKVPNWDKRMVVVKQGEFRKAFRDEWVAASSVDLPEHPLFKFVSVGSDWIMQSISVRPDVHILVHNSEKALAGFPQGKYPLSAHYVQLRPTDLGATMPLNDVLKSLPSYLESIKIDGITCEFTSDFERDWAEPYQRSHKQSQPAAPRIPNPKHKASVFTLDMARLANYTGWSRKPCSDYWTTSAKDVDVNSVYVVVFEFKPATTLAPSELSLQLLLLKTFCDRIKMPFPEIYGYKQAQLDKMRNKGLPTGTEVTEWLPRFFASMLAANPDFHRAFQQYAWQYQLERRVNCYNAADSIAVSLTLELGSDHALSVAFNNYTASRYGKDREEIAELLKSTHTSTWDELCRRFDGSAVKSEAHEHWAKIDQTYPFVFHSSEEDTNTQLQYLQPRYGIKAVRYQSVLQYIRSLDFYNREDRTIEDLARSNARELRRLTLIDDFDEEREAQHYGTTYVYERMALPAARAEADEFIEWATDQALLEAALEEKRIQDKIAMPTADTVTAATQTDAKTPSVLDTLDTTLTELSKRADEDVARIDTLIQLLDNPAGSTP